jgi:hypothetical protein
VRLPSNLRVAISLSLLAVAACAGGAPATSGGQGTTTGGHDPGTGGQGATTSTGGAGTGGGGATGGAGGAVTPQNAGQITVDSWTDVNSAVHFIQAAFWENPNTAGCQKATIGACTYSHCPPPGTNASSVDAGNLVLTSPKATSTLSPLPNHGYNEEDDFSTFFLPGETITVEASGAGVPAFTGSVVSPVFVHLSGPIDWPSGPTIHRMLDLDVDWKGASTGELAVQIGIGYDSVDCAWDVGAGHGTVPKQLLQKLPKGLADASFHQRVTTVIAAGAYKVAFTASEYALFPNDFPSSVAITLD